jgi:hypothetical protein
MHFADSKVLFLCPYLGGEPLKAYYGSKISPHMTKTPEGFLICHSVPICRTGRQDYLPHEIGLQGSNLVNVEREEKEVFAPAAIASFEGKPVTDDHPPMEVNSSNYGAYTKGVIQNIHRGVGADNNKLVCDIVVYDAALIGKIESGKREVSCGYDCKYMPNEDGSYRQVDIVGNHVAIVDNGRAGHEVSIKDSMPKGVEKMATRKKGNILQRMFATFARDAEPEEIREAARAVDDAEFSASEGEEKPQPQRTMDDETMEMIMGAIHELNQKIEKLQHAQQSHDEEPPEEKLSGIDAVEAHLKSVSATKRAEDGYDDEEDAEVPPEQLNADEDTQESGVIEPKSEDEDESEEMLEEKQNSTDHAISLAMLRAIKPIIAEMPAKQRVRASDALNRAVKKALRVKETQPLKGGYGALLKRKTTDAANHNNLKAFGDACRKRNPHYKK